MRREPLPCENDPAGRRPLKMLMLRRALLRWVLAAIAVPVAAEVADRLGRGIETRRGRTRLSDGLRGGATRLRRQRAKRRRW